MTKALSSTWASTELAPSGANGEAAGGDDLIERLRLVCLAQPGAHERLSHGEPAWFAHNGRLFVSLADHHHDDRLALWCAAETEERDALVAEAPQRFFVPPYVGHRGWLGVYLDVAHMAGDWPEIEEIIRVAHGLVTRRRPRPAR